MSKQIMANSIVSSRLRLLSISTALVFFVAISTAEAQWQIEPYLRVAADVDDNAYLSTGTTHDTESGYIVEGSARFGYTSEATDFFITPILRTKSYGSDTDLDSDDQFLRFNINHDTRSSNFQMRGNYSRQSVRTAERADTDFDILDPDEIPDDDSGLVGIKDRREWMQISPTFTYNMSNISSVAVSLNHADVRYDESFLGFLTDYTDTRLGLTYRRIWSERNTGILNATYRTYQTDQGDNEFDGIGLNVGFDRSLSQTTRFRATAGLEDTDVSGDASEVSWVTDISLVRSLQTISLLAQYRRSISASGSGRLGARDSFNLNFRRDLNDRISAGLGVRAYITNPVDPSIVGFDERSYVQLRSQFTWRVTDVFSIDANYRYSFLDRENIGESANSNQVTIWFNYKPNPIIR
jgi:hypothetical protein